MATSKPITQILDRILSHDFDMPPPPVELSTTLSELYSLDGGDANDIALLYTIPAPSQRPLSISCPLSFKYAYQSPRSTKVGPDTTARFVLGCMAQFYGFISGSMDLHLFDVDATRMERAMSTFSWTAAERSHRIDARRTYERVQADQRPRLHFIEMPEQAVQLGQTKKLATVSPMDFLDHDPQITVVPQEAHWKMLSKRTLAESGLPTPPTEIIESELVALSNGAAVDPVTNPFYQRGLSDPYANVDFVPDKDVDKETTRMLASLEQRPVPFVVKLPHGYGGHAVFVVRDEQQRQHCLDTLREQLPDFLPTCLLVQDLLPGKSIAVSFFVTKAGRAVFVSASEEVHNEAGSWTGGLMDYAAQDALAAQRHRHIVQADQQLAPAHAALPRHCAHRPSASLTAVSMAKPASCAAPARTLADGSAGVSMTVRQLRQIRKAGACPAPEREQATKAFSVSTRWTNPARTRKSRAR